MGVSIKIHVNKPELNVRSDSFYSLLGVSREHGTTKIRFAKPFLVLSTPFWEFLKIDINTSVEVNSMAFYSLLGVSFKEAM